jgi:flagellar basal-body rod protein FlgF
MLKGLYSSASGMLSGMNRQTVLSHNISNIETPGFKQVLLSMADWKKTPVSSVVDPSTELPYASSFYPAINSQTLSYLGQLGLGVYNPPSTTDFSQGSLETTSQPLDMAIQGDGFFYVQTPSGNRFTRDGRFQLDANNNLVTVDGYFVLDKSGGKISLPSNDVSVQTDGTLYAGGTAQAQLGVFSFTNPETDLVREENMFVAVGAPTTGDSKVYNSVLESSNVDMTQTAAQLITVARSYESSQKMVTQQDTILNKAISTLGQYS